MIIMPQYVSHFKVRFLESNNEPIEGSEILDKQLTSISEIKIGRSDTNKLSLVFYFSDIVQSDLRSMLQRLIVRAAYFTVIIDGYDTHGVQTYSMQLKECFTVMLHTQPLTHRATNAICEPQLEITYRQASYREPTLWS